MEEPILFISSPPVYFTEIVEVKETFLEESTSVFVPNRTDRIIDQVIARQLNYFSQPVNQFRTLVFHLSNGEKVVGKVDEVMGSDVKIKSANQFIMINGNDINTITIANGI
ncbi:4-diphosphocytidyl-2C-methyl-D-erythritol kinase [Lysinibacillus sp. SGAir0095]|uniref:4-diphosphocytidyl-2C-methyl-D-erythritol kinase n=1 Tax=Lysinibacillus sp. SGAir0095 TaxID=2070463 RepID=UPI0010CCC24A|nr:4-diphosphocytidyl-2C-methyl-D-erythritol kinase [Lysinibacillus sp. SGAir0095]QCR31598.1 4-diphosphocytidyl-2C-methyl-D-erythritol kinase [Lysinibacillus sp. SGAir0095]